jgi:Uri superfamily endonuclease
LRQCGEEKVKKSLNKEDIFPASERNENSKLAELLATDAPGAYAIVILLKRRCDLPVGRLGIHSFAPGYSIYLGSALGPGGVRARVQRHLRCTTMKPAHWQVDRLLAVGEIVEVWWRYGKERMECLWSARLSKIGSIQVPGFGASDCRCPGHLVRFEDRNRVSIAYKHLGVDLHRQKIVETHPLAPPG